VNSSRREPYGQVECGCILTRRRAGGGWWLYEIHACRSHREVPARFWMAPCQCVAWSDGVRVSCSRHAFLSPFQAAAGGLH